MFESNHDLPTAASRGAKPNLVGLENGDARTGIGEDVSGAQTGKAAPNDDHIATPTTLERVSRRRRDRGLRPQRTRLGK